MTERRGRPRFPARILRGNDHEPSFEDDDPRLLLLPKRAETIQTTSAEETKTRAINRYALPSPPEQIFENIDRSQALVVRRETIANSVTESYMREKWGVLRIALDGIQNHLPQDSGGSWVGVQFLSQGIWYDLSYIQDFKNGHVQAVRFVDDGKGFVAEELGVMATSKAGERRKAGQFGEGLKMISAAALRNGMEVSIESRDWQATPSFRIVQLTDRKEQQLVYDVNFYEQKITGSRTTFLNPTREFLKVIRELEQYALPVRGNSYNPAIALDEIDLVDSQGNVYIKGLRYARGLLSTFFSYNFVDLPDRAIERDRESIRVEEVNRDVASAVRKVLEKLDDKDSILDICSAGLNGAEDLIEFSLLQRTKVPWQLYEDAIYEIAGTRKVFIAGGGNLLDWLKSKRAEAYLRLQGYKGIIVADDNFRSFLNYSVGIPLAKDNFVINKVLDETRDEGFRILLEDELTEKEQQVFDLHQMVDEVLETSKEITQRQVVFINVQKSKKGYEYLFIDQQACNGLIVINRKLLSDPAKFLQIFFQKRAEQIVGHNQLYNAGDLMSKKIAKLLIKLKKAGIKIS